MGILATLRQDRAGEWKTLDDYLRELRHREAGALAALANALPAPSHEQKELAESGEAGAVLLEVACDLRVPKRPRLAPARGRARAAARRVGLAPQWPPNLREAFTPMVREAEQQPSSVESADAATNPTALKPAAAAVAAAPAAKRSKPPALPPGKTLAPP